MDQAERKRLGRVLVKLGEDASAADSAVAMCSRRNRLLDVKLPDGRRIAVKFFRYPTARREFDVLSRLRDNGVVVPEPLDFGDDWLASEMIDGPTLMDLVNEGERDSLFVEGLPGWLAEFHGCMAEDTCARIKGDCNLRNFIAPAGGDIVGVDFENCPYGEPAEDVADACVSLLASDPPFTPRKIDLSRMMVQTYRGIAGEDLDDLDGYVARMLIELSKWRPQHREWLWRWAIQVEVWSLEDLARRVTGK